MIRIFTKPNIIMNDSANLLLVQNQFLKPSTAWLLFLFLGWSYGSMGKMGMQILFYLTLGGFGLWALIRLFTLNGAIRDYNREIAVRNGLNVEQMRMVGV
jgi:hypothetical protein